MNRRTIITDTDTQMPTGKTAKDENFPVASLMIAPLLRPYVRAFYAFARAADDIADSPALSSAEKIAGLDLMEQGLTGPGPEVARTLADSLAACSVTDRHARDLLAAFRQDAVKSRYADWDELIGYCELSANPVGRYLMDLHGEDRGLWPASDALCTVLQVLNHLQDCQQDYRELDRVYLPLDLLVAERLAPKILDSAEAPSGLRNVLNNLLDRCDALLITARLRPVKSRSRRLAAQLAVITRLAARLSRRLRSGDPLAGRVSLTRSDFTLCALGGLPTLILPGRP